MNTETWMLFFTTCLITSFTPGPSVIAVIKESSLKGLKRTLPMLIGVLTGLFILAILSALGLGIVLDKSKILFTTLRYIGAGYLFYLGVRAFFYSQEIVNYSEDSKKKNSLFFKGMGLTLANPKALAYFSSLFIPFIDKNGNFIFQCSILMSTMLGCSILALLFYGIISERANSIIKKYSNMFNKLIGVLFMLFSILVVNDD